jgi:serine protease Do
MTWLRRLARNLFASAYIALALAHVAAAEVERTAYLSISRSLVKVLAIDAGGKYSLGTGIVVGRGKVITNCHVTIDAVRVQLSQDGATWEASAQQNDLKRDVCLLSANNLDIPAVRLGTAKDLKLRQEVGAAGFALGSNLHFMSGLVSGLHAYEGSHVIQTTTEFFPGDSGGALFDSDGQLVGVLTFYFDQSGAQRHFAIPVDWFLPHIARADRYQVIAPLRGEGPFWNRRLDALPYFMRAVALEAHGRWNALLTLTKKWAAEEPASAEAWLTRGNAYRKLGEETAATVAYEQAAAIDPNFSPAWYALGSASTGHGQTQALESAVKPLAVRAKDQTATLTAHKDSRHDSNPAVRVLP